MNSNLNKKLSACAWEIVLCPYQFLMLFLFSAATLCAQSAQSLRVTTTSAATDDVLAPTWETQKNARTYLLNIPAPRGQIVDRNGVPMAQMRVAQNLAIHFPTPLQFTDDQAVLFGRQQIAMARALLPGRTPVIDDAQLLKFYKLRGALPLVIVEDLKPEELENIKGRLPAGLRLQPSYVRCYPLGSVAGHILGYCGKVGGGVPDWPIQNNDPLWPDFEGREGIEQTFNTQLQGKPGQLNIVIDRAGVKVTERVSIPPQPGDNVVLSLDAGLQRICEEVLAKRAKRGAIVFIQPSTGDILAMASWPSINPNAFTPSISAQAFQALQDDPFVPLLPRAFRSAYPAGSTFKIFVGMAALESGAITPTTTFGCPSAISVGNLVFRNWKKTDSGYLNFRDALEQSCNTWFYRVGMKTGADALIEWAFRCGLGRSTGIPLRAEAEGRIPTQDYFRQTRGHKILDGDVCNLSIGQGDILISPLQMAQAMVPIANGGTLLQMRLVRQVQGIDNSIKVAYQVRATGYLGLRAEYLDELREAMVEVVHGSSGTGSRAAPKGLRVAGKTGTAQWGPKSKQRTAAWFAGFAPASQPQYAFAALFEGDPQDDAHGGTHAAPMIGDVLAHLYPPPSKSSNKGSNPDEVRRAEPAQLPGSALPPPFDDETQPPDESN